MKSPGPADKDKRGAGHPAHGGRTKARVLALTNWRGVFFMQYGLDPHVTALEGANGAGKTTVMIAAYVVLLPDMSRLRFTNLGESGATGGDRGIWGRLGEPGRPSYAVMDLELGDGQRMLAGVMLERRGEPTVEPTPFVVHGLPAEVPLSEVLLDKKGEVELVPELDQIKARVQAAGGKLKVFSTAKDYFAELFDRGVLPLRMQADEERQKLNEMLRTSMVGGISRALTGGMREFLLREESGLAEVLRRMRGNLEACRKTRREVEEARRLEGEIHAVWEAGEAMFTAVVHAARGEAEVRSQALEAARTRAEQSQAQAAGVARELEAKKARSEELAAERARLKDEVQAAAARVERAKRAWDVARRLARLTREREGLEAERALKEGADEVAQAERERARASWDRAREALSAASRGVADLKAGLEELERRAAEHRLAHERLAQVKATLVDEEVDLTRPQALGQLEARVKARLVGIDQELVRIERTLASSAVMRAEYERVHEALEKLSGVPVLSGHALEQAREVLAELRDLEGEARALPELERRLAAARTAAGKQKDARERARLLGALASAGEVERALGETEAAHQLARAAADAAEAALAEATRDGRDAERALRELEPILARRDAVTRQAARLAERAAALGLQLRAGGGRAIERLVALRQEVEARREAARATRSEAQGEAARIERELAALALGERDAGAGERGQGGLLSVRDAVGGELFASRFEALPVETAALAEATLGPLCDAIAVEDPVASAKKAAKVGERPDELWFVGPRAALPLDDDGTPFAEVVEDAVLLEQNGIVRLTRVPAAPRLGSSARKARREALEATAATLAATVERAREEERGLQEVVRAIDELMPESGLIDRGEEPVAAYAGHRARAEQAAAARQAALSERQRALGELEALERRRAGLRKLLPEAHWLDLADQLEEARALEARVKAVRASEARLRVAAAERRILESGLDALRIVPASEAEISGLKKKIDGFARMRDELQLARERVAWLAAHQGALAWQDAQSALSARQELGPALEVQLAQAEAEVERAEAAIKAAEARARATAEAAARAGGALIALDQQIEAAKSELGEIAPGEVRGERAVEAEEGQLMALEREAEAAEQAEREVRAQVVRGEERHRQLGERAREDAWRLAEEERAFAPAQARWARLREEAGAHGVLAAAFSERSRAAVEGRQVSELWLRARQRASVLIERVGRARDGVEVAEALRAHLESLGAAVGGWSRDAGEGDSAEAADAPDAIGGDVTAWLAQWLSVRDWLRRRVPPQIAEVADPLEALGRLREHLGRLEERLATQEQGLRGHSGDVARNIDAQIRRARNQVARLNQDLDGVRFGAIEGMQIRARPAQKTDAVLRALRDGAAQQLLFEPNLPIEEAMEELFKRYGGGRMGGDKLLDYREYLDLQVEVRRRGKEIWEVANPTRLSTGEAIGVGAAVMMATLKAWEAEANLLRPRHLAGTLRLLFLDEATRLSQDNLGILFELCERLELQLLIAAPEVARAEGNTTYRLVRALDADGREEVRVSGRRVLAKGEAEAMMARPAEA